MLPRIVAGIQQNVMVSTKNAHAAPVSPALLIFFATSCSLCFARQAIVKHYIGNTQETDRGAVNELVPEKLLMELYGPPFAAAVANAAGVMCAYNRVNGVYACENQFTLKTMLKERYNFSGFVVSDWGACHSTSGSLQGGLDIEMPMSNYFTEVNDEVHALTVPVSQMPPLTSAARFARHPPPPRPTSARRWPRAT